MQKITPKTQNQINYVKNLKNFKIPIVFALGPPGSGKTLLACQEGIQQIKSKSTRQLIITRPLITVDENIGFLPGTIKSKFDPYTTPIYDSFHKLEASQNILNNVEISPLAYMRGRTFDDSFVIADEMQNATINQMHMFLTRIGSNSKLIITGDLSQIDIETSGLQHFLNLYKESPDCPYISIVYMDETDIQRHPAVTFINDIFQPHSVNGVAL